MQNAYLKKIAAKTLNAPIYFLIYGPLGKPAKRETELIEELRNESKKNDAFSKADVEAEDAWMDNLIELRELIRTKDPRRFLQWDLIRKTMFVESSSYIKEEYNYLKKNDWSTWKQAIRETRTGCPSPFLQYPLSSENSVHHAYHLVRFQNQTGEKIANADLVFEFGGGYGSMCRLIHKMGFKGKYVILDLPVVSALQVFFLKMTGLDAELGLNMRSHGISCVSGNSQIERLLQNTPCKRSVFIATWSISETPVEKRNFVLKLVRSFDSFLLACQKSFGDVDNIAFFKKWTAALGSIEWCTSKIPHLPRSFYIFGSKPKSPSDYLSIQVPEQTLFQEQVIKPKIAF